MNDKEIEEYLQSREYIKHLIFKTNRNNFISEVLYNLLFVPNHEIYRGIINKYPDDAKLHFKEYFDFYLEADIIEYADLLFEYYPDKEELKTILKERPVKGFKIYTYLLNKLNENSNNY